MQEKYECQRYERFFIQSMKKISLLVNSLHVYEWFDLAILKENAGEARMCMA